MAQEVEHLSSVLNMQEKDGLVSSQKQILRETRQEEENPTGKAGSTNMCRLRSHILKVTY
jgi:hypothetical protein